jgi:hypothetical protein
MCNSSKGLLKRFIPFFLTFAAGLLIASFFVPVTAPSFGRGRGKRHRAQHEQMERDIQRLREENLNLKMELKEARERSIDWSTGEFPLMDAPVPPVAFEAPAPPPPPKAPAHSRR